MRKIRRLKNRLARRMRIKRFVWQSSLARLLDDMRSSRKQPKKLMGIRIIRVSDKTVLKLRRLRG